MSKNNDSGGKTHHVNAEKGDRVVVHTGNDSKPSMVRELGNAAADITNSFAGLFGMGVKK